MTSMKSKSDPTTPRTAYEEGYAARRVGATTSPYPYGSAADLAWCNGWTDASDGLPSNATTYESPSRIEKYRMFWEGLKDA